MFSADYDEEADVLYLNYTEGGPQPAADSAILNDCSTTVIERYAEDGTIIGHTILNPGEALGLKK